MDNGSEKTACALHALELILRWVAELGSHQRPYAFDLMNLVMAGEMTNEEAFSLLDNAPHQGTPIP
jgi:hypothetical protein